MCLHHELREVTRCSQVLILGHRVIKLKAHVSIQQKILQKLSLSIACKHLLMLVLHHITQVKSSERTKFRCKRTLTCRINCKTWNSSSLIEYLQVHHQCQIGLISQMSLSYKTIYLSTKQLTKHDILTLLRDKCIVKE